MMAKKNYGFLVCLLIMALDVTAGVLGIQAEVAQNKVINVFLCKKSQDGEYWFGTLCQMKHLRMSVFECREPSYKAFQLGLAASVLLALAHIVANLLGGCVCIFSKRDLAIAPPNKQLAVTSLIFSWIALAIAFSLLVVGTVANLKSIASCGPSHHRLFSVGGIICFIHGLYTVAYYVSTTTAV